MPLTLDELNAKTPEQRLDEVEDEVDGLGTFIEALEERFRQKLEDAETRLTRAINRLRADLTELEERVARLSR